LINVKDLSVILGERSVLEGVSIELPESGIVVIYGPSGGGKTTLLRTLIGVIPEVIKGDVHGRIFPSPKDIRSKCVYVPQEPWFSVATPYVWSEVSSFTNLSISEVKHVLQRFGLEGKLYRTTHTLSAGELHRIGLITAMASSYNYLFLDEPSSYLDRENALALAEYVKEISDSGKLVIIVDHNLGLWKKYADSFIRINRRVIYTEPSYVDDIVEDNSLRRPETVGEIVGRVLIKEFRYPGERPVIKDLSFTICAGDIIHIKGPSGSGKTTLLRLIARKARSSKIHIELHRSVCYVPDNPLLYFSEPTPLKEVLGRIDIMKEFGIDHIKNVPIMRTSSGERRRIAIASAIIRGHDIILLDEPTVGLDLENKIKVLKTVVKAANIGKAFIIASHDPLVETIATKTITLGGSNG